MFYLDLLNVNTNDITHVQQQAEAFNVQSVKFDLVPQMLLSIYQEAINKATGENIALTAVSANDYRGEHNGMEIQVLTNYLDSGIIICGTNISIEDFADLQKALN